MTPSIRCHYDILQISRDADEKTIKKAHRKLALKFHPDKTGGCEEAAKEFRLVQQAYECLSDPSERKWYDEHRDSILRGGKGFNDGSGDDANGSSFIFDVTPFHFSGCFDGYGDNDGGFFQVYREVFENILKGERNGWVSEGNIDETEMPNAHLPHDFGCGSTDWKTISHFYNSWEGFNSCLSFAFADKYDPRDAESRWVRRRIDEENKKARKNAKKERNQEVIEFVLFLKKLDPRVKAAKERAIKEKLLKEKQREEEDHRKKLEAAAARENWKLERERELQQAEMDDLNAGRIRLADLSDSDDDYYYRGKKGKKGKKGKRNKRQNRQMESSSSDEEDEDETDTQNDTIEDSKTTLNVADNANVHLNTDEGEDGDDIINELLEEDARLHAQGEEDIFCDEESSEDESEPEVYRCECCRKTFKSDAQLDNHLKSKKHKEAYKKWLKQQK